jgi:hypothetical protein
MGMKNAYKDLDRKPERKRPLGELCADFKEIIWEGLNWVCLAQDVEP